MMQMMENSGALLSNYLKKIMLGKNNLSLKAPISSFDYKMIKKSIWSRYLTSW